jgi:hypothetical protein
MARSCRRGPWRVIRAAAVAPEPAGLSSGAKGPGARPSWASRGTPMQPMCPTFDFTASVGSRSERSSSGERPAVGDKPAPQGRLLTPVRSRSYISSLVIHAARPHGLVMLDIRARIRVNADHSISGVAPPEVPPGEHEVTIVVAMKPVRQVAPKQFDVDRLPVVDLGPWPEGISLRREDLYGDDGR